MSSLNYLRLQPTKASQFDIQDSKQLLDFIYKDKKSDSKLVIKIDKKRGIQFIIGQGKNLSYPLLNEIQAISPKLRAQKISSNWQIKGTNTTNLRLKRHYAYPLYMQGSDDELYKLLNQLSRSGTDMTIELDIKPINPLKIKILRKRLLNGEMPLLFNHNLLGEFIKPAAVFIFEVINIFKLSVNIFGSTLGIRPYIANKKIQSPKSITLLDKLYEPLFKVGMSIQVKNKTYSRDQVLNQLLLNLNKFMESTGEQRLVITKKLRKDIYSSLDLAALFHFNKTDLKSGLYDVSNFKELPLPFGLSSRQSPQDLVLGYNMTNRLNNDVWLHLSARKHHTYISGATGSGKSNLLSNIITQALSRGSGLTLIDPHGDLASEIRRFVPVNRIKDLIYFDPCDTKNVPAIDLFEMKTRFNTPENIVERDQITESVIAIFRKLFNSEDINSHRLEYVLRNSLQTALLIKDSDIFTVFKLLTDNKFRQRIIPLIKDQNLRNFWQNELSQAGDYQRVKMSAGITSKIGRFLFSETVKNIFTSNNPKLNFDDLLDRQKILVCDLSKGRIGEDNSKLIASTILAKIQLAAQARVGQDKRSRISHFLYVDEFQTFAPRTLIQMLSESRKYGLYLTMAEQSPSQQDSHTTNEILANVGNIITFRTASPIDAELLCPILSNNLKLDDLVNLPSYVFYLKTIGEKSSELTSVNAYSANKYFASNNELSKEHVAPAKNKLIEVPT